MSCRCILAFAAFHLALAGLAAEPVLSWETRDGRTWVRWDAGGVARQLRQGTNLVRDLSSWPVAAAEMAPDGSWQAPLPTDLPWAFFGLAFPEPPGLPADVRMVSTPSELRMEWKPAPEAAGYVLYLGSLPFEKPEEAEQVQPLGPVPRAILTGLVPGRSYYLRLQATNLAGASGLTDPLHAVYGPTVPVNGVALFRHRIPKGQTFLVGAAGVGLGFFGSGPTAGPLPRTTTDRHGRFHLPGLSPGSYRIDWSSPDGNSGGLAGQVTLSDSTATSNDPLNPLWIEGEPGAVVGRVFLQGSQFAATDQDLWDLHLRARVVAKSQQGQVLAETTGDSRGGFALPPLPGFAYPVQVEASYGPLRTSVVIPQAPKLGESPPIQVITFPQRLPRVLRIVARQQGQETRQVLAGIPVEFSAEVDNPDGLPLDFRWHTEQPDGPKRQQKDTARFTWAPPRNGGPADGGPVSVEVTVRLNLSDLVETSSADAIRLELVPDASVLPRRYSGLVVEWNPSDPDVYRPLGGASVRITPPGGETATSTANPGGFFESTVDPNTFNPSLPNFLVRVEKAGHMPFVWPIASPLPQEQVFPLMPLEISTHAFNGEALLVSHEDLVEVAIPANGLRTETGAPYLGSVQVGTARFDPLSHQPLPPNVGIDQRGALMAARVFAAAYVEIRDTTGALLVPVSAQLLFPPFASRLAPESRPACRQREDTGYFEPLAEAAIRPPTGGKYAVPIQQGGLYLLAEAREPGYIPHLVPDRTLNLPFHLLIGQSLFPITLHRDAFVRLPFLYPIPGGEELRLRVPDLRQSPGLAYPTLSTDTILPPHAQPMVIHRTFRLPTTPPAGLESRSEVLSIGASIPGMLRAAATSVNDLHLGRNQFLSRTTNVFDPREPFALTRTALEYYEEIQAPERFLDWKRLNGFPEAFGAALPGVPSSDLAVAYYYNLADLGFARAQSMRIRTGPDGRPDVAFYVTNYRTLEDARLGRSAVATVAMDYALRADRHGGLHRHTRFYTYVHGDGRPTDGRITPGADLDGAGEKNVPSLCVVCHGGRRYERYGSADLESRFLPFDLETYTFHPAFGPQQGALARMNEGVLKTREIPATDHDIGRLILGWYGGVPPNSNPGVFHRDYIPPGWTLPPPPTSPSLPRAPVLYDAFKVGCRGCHLSREGTGGPQFSLEAAFYGGYSVCNSLQMPHSQRTWGAFWGSRAAFNLGSPAAADLPALLHAHDGATGPCPAVGP